MRSRMIELKIWLDEINHLRDQLQEKHVLLKCNTVQNQALYLTNQLSKHANQENILKNYSPFLKELLRELID